MDLWTAGPLLRPVVWASLEIVAAAAAGPRAVCGPDPFHLSAGLLHGCFRNPQGRFNLPEKEKSTTYHTVNIPTCWLLPNISNYLLLEFMKNLML